MPDILLIQKYLNGELNARAMHELERRALDNPFLAEALEGYTTNGKNQQVNIDELQQRLQQRIQPQRKRIALWQTISIAASVLVFIGFGGWWLLNYRPVSNQPDLPVVDKTDVARNKPDTTLPQPLKSPNGYKPQQQAVIKPKQKHALPNGFVEPQAPVSNERDKDNANVDDNAELKKEAGLLRYVAKDSSARGNKLEDVVVVGYGVQKRKDITGSIATINADSVKAKSMKETLAGRLAGVNVSAAPMIEPQVRIRGVSSLYKKGDSIKLVTGQILSATDKQPLPGVTVRVNSNGLAVGTDAQGRFKIAATKMDELSFGYIGFESQKVKINGKDSLKVLLKENHSALSEVVVVGYGNREPEEVITEAHPKNGWSKFYEYLDDEARVSTGKTGVVRVSFVVGVDGTLSDFKILKSLSPDADKEAIEIIKDGADWIPNVNRKPQTVKLRIRFRQEK